MPQRCIDRLCRANGRNVWETRPATCAKQPKRHRSKHVCKPNADVCLVATVGEPAPNAYLLSSWALSGCAAPGHEAAALKSAEQFTEAPGPARQNGSRRMPSTLADRRNARTPPASSAAESSTARAHQYCCAKHIFATAETHISKHTVDAAPSPGHPLYATLPPTTRTTNCGLPRTLANAEIH